MKVYLIVVKNQISQRDNVRGATNDLQTADARVAALKQKGYEARVECATLEAQS